MKNSQKVQFSLIVVDCVKCKTFLKAKTVTSVVRSIIPQLLKVLSDIPQERASQAVTIVLNLVLGSLSTQKTFVELFKTLGLFKIIYRNSVNSGQLFQ